MTAPLTIWAVSDGRAGIEAQAEGLALAVARLRPSHITLRRIGWRFGVGRLPTALNPGWPSLLAPGSAIAPPWPDIWIAAGRATLPLSTRVRRWSRGQTFVVQAQDPRTRLDAFDLVVPPAHDGLSGANVFPIAGAPNRLAPDRLAADLARFEAQLASLPRPRIAVIVGGKSKVFDLPAQHAAELGDRIAAAVRDAGGSVMVSFTRRTPTGAEAALRAALSALPGVIWDGSGENPYFAYLAAADAVLVTEESTNLATDAAATGKPVHILPLPTRQPGGGAKFTRFHADLAARGVSRPFDGTFPVWSYPPLRETDRAAAELLSRYDARQDLGARR